MIDAPSGTVTFVFTDIEGSTKLLHALGREKYGEALREHQRLLREVWARHEGFEVDTEGDAFFVAFARPSAALSAAAAAQLALARAAWPDGTELRVRMGVHSGEASVHGGKYVGVAVHRAARICAAAHGEQVLLSQTTADLCTDEELGGIALRDVGLHRLKDLTHPQRLYQLTGEGIRSVFPPPRTLENRPTNLPVQPTPFIGRGRESNEVGALMRTETVRLLTLTGAGGTGKTRLALQVAADLIEEYPNGVFFVSLAPIFDPLLVLPSVAQTLGVKETAGESLQETLSGYLFERRTLLVLDNFEQLLPAAPEVAALLQRTRNLKLLVTSRAPLHLSAEHEYAVPPLVVPAIGGADEPDALSQYESVALFIERAKAVRPDFGLNEQNAPAVAEICVRLDGLPLAIELAAARVRVLPPASLLARLDQRLQLLTGRARDVPERHQTLRAAVDWSYSLLSPEEQRVFARLSVFVGGCALDAAEAVCADDDRGISALDVIESLVEKSLLREAEAGNGEPRFWMLETIREYATERLDAQDDADAVRERHATFYRRLAEEAARELEGGDRQSEWMMRLDEEHANIRAALTHWRCEAEAQLSLVLAVEPFWRLRGHWQEGRKWHEEALARTSLTDSRRLKTLDNAQYFSYLLKDLDRARVLAEELLPLARAAGNRSRVAMALNGLGLIASEEGDDDRAEAFFEESLQFCEGEHDSIHPLSNLGFAAFARNDFTRARDFYERSIAVGRAYQDEYEMTADTAILAMIAAFAGDEDAAATLLREAVGLSERLDSRSLLAIRCLPAMAALRSLRGEIEVSVELIAAYEAQREEMGLPPSRVSRDYKRRIVEAATGKITAGELDEALQRGRSLTLEAAFADIPAAPAASTQAR